MPGSALNGLPMVTAALAHFVDIRSPPATAPIQPPLPASPLFPTAPQSTPTNGVTVPIDVVNVKLSVFYTHTPLSP